VNCRADIVQKAGQRHFFRPGAPSDHISRFAHSDRASGACQFNCSGKPVGTGTDDRSVFKIISAHMVSFLKRLLFDSQPFNLPANSGGA
jgi:hypothetical protein